MCRHPTLHTAPRPDRASVSCQIPPECTQRTYTEPNTNVPINSHSKWLPPPPLAFHPSEIPSAPIPPCLPATPHTLPPTPAYIYPRRILHRSLPAPHPFLCPTPSLMPAPAPTTTATPRDPVSSPTGRPLGAMFTAVVASIDIPTRRHLADIVSFCHTRRQPIADARAAPILFYPARDDVIQSTAQPHLRTLEAQYANSDLSASRRRTPLNDCCPALDETALMSRMDDETRNQYLLARLYGYGREVVELGYRYFHHLARPDLPLKETLRQLPVDDCDETKPGGIAAADTDEEYSDDEMMFSDEEDSLCSHISDVTYESELSQPIVVGPTRAITDTSPDRSSKPPSVDGTIGGR